MARTWACAATPPACPAAEPLVGEACTTGTGGAAGCPYDGATCTCDAERWACALAVPTCPTTMPTPGATCTDGTGGAAGCTYGTNTTCRCEAAGAGDEWTCN
jgi:hypothetical protein